MPAGLMYQRFTSDHGRDASREKAPGARRWLSAAWLGTTIAAIGVGAHAEPLGLRTGPEDAGGPPRVVHVATVAPHILALEIHAGDIQAHGQTPYTPEPGDEIKPHAGQHTALVWGGDGLEVQPEHWALHRVVDGQPRAVGFITADHRWVWAFDRVSGASLDEAHADQPQAYRITSATDPNYADAATPVAVHRKSKPRQHTDPDKAAAMLHRVYLELPHALQEGVPYTVELNGLDTQPATVTYHHNPRQQRSEAVHASHIGYRPDDPYKAAFLSLWRGTGGGLAYDDIPRFELLDEAGETQFVGEVTRTKALGETERLREDQDYAMTAVYRLDFSVFDQPGVYRVYVPGVGTSGPVTIADTVWADAFRTSMLGLLHHRSGIELGPPTTEHQRPRGFHPADGFKVFELDVVKDGESAAVDEALQRLTDRGLRPRDQWPPTHDDAWGGYMDAGDWDRRSDHLMVSYLHLELLALFPDYFAALPLTVPGSEADNALPDLLDEALWNLEFYRRVQGADGGVSGGIESTGHPRWGEASWQESMAAGLFRPESETSYRFAAVGAKAARVLESYDTDLATRYRDAAARAWAWAAAHEQESLQLGRNADATAGRVDRAKRLAAVELLGLTRDITFDRVFQELSPLANGNGQPDEHAAFAYANLPPDLGTPQTRQAAREHIVGLADRAIAFAEGNSYGLINAHPDLPLMGYVGYLSVPGMISRSAPRAHALTGEPRYLAATVQSANAAAGANPDNMAFTTGVGWNPPRNPLHIDSRITGRAAPPGITVYGPSDPAAGFRFNEWMHTWFLGKQMTPDSRSWPMHESYVDAGRWPAVNEYTVHQTLGPTGYTWGYLAARAAASPEPTR